MHPTTSHSGSVSPRPPQQNQQQQQKQQLGDGSTVVDAKSPAGNPTSSSNGSTASTGSAAMDLAAALSSGGGPSMSGTGTSYMAGNQHQHHNHGSGPVSKRAAFVPSIVSIVDSMTTAAAGTLALPPMTPASAREPRSAVFFVDLTSPVSMKPLATITTSTTTTSRAPLVSPTAQKMRLAVRLAEASHARSSIMHERKRKLRLRADYIKRKVMLQRHRDRLMAMKHKAAVDFALSSAHIKRQLMLQDRAEHFGAIVDRAQRVAIMRRLEQSAALRRSVSASFAETLGALVSLDDYLEAEEMAEAGDDFGELNDGDEGGSTPNRFPAAIVTSSSSSATRHDEPAYVSPTSPVSPSVAGHLVHAAAATSPTSSTGTTPTPTPASVRSNSSVMKTPTPFSATVTAPPTDISAAAGAFDSDPATPPASPKRAGSPIAGKVATATVRFESMPALLTLSAVLDRVREADNHPETPSPVGAPRPADVLPGSRVGLAPTSTTAHDDIEEVGGLDGLLPPITRHTLRELDVTEILANAQLRHDLIFDPDMQFRPNLDGGRGTARAAKSDAYWAEIEAEIADAERADRVGPAARQQRSWFRVPMLLLEIREIVRELLVPGTPSSTGTGTSVAAPGEPATLNHQLNEIMDIDLMTQALQQSRSLANAAGGAVAFIASQMHAYCAPCRDPLIDSMVEKFTTGQYVDGFKLCLEVCEFMKLDFANHHLKKLRPWIIENACEYEWKYFKEQSDAGLVSIDATEQWLERAAEETTDKPLGHIYNYGVIQLVTNHDLVANGLHPDVPETFRMDGSRLTSYYNEFQDVSIMATLLFLFKQACGKPGPASSDSVATKRVLWTLLNHADTTMAHVAAQLASDAAKVRRRPYLAPETASLTSLVDATLTFDNPVFLLIQKRVRGVLVAALDANDGQVAGDEALAKITLADVRDELQELAGKIRILADHNRATYRPLYNAILQARLQRIGGSATN